MRILSGLRQKHPALPILIGLVLCALLVMSLLVLASRILGTPSDCLHTSGSKILNSSNEVVGLSGVNWFGFETPEHAPHGLAVRNWGDLLDQVKAQGYNVIRLPFSNAMLKPGVKPTKIDYTLNPDLQGLSSLEVMDKIIAGAESRGLKVILDNHRSTSGKGPESNGLWYTQDYPESQWISDWQQLVSRYRDSAAIIGVDLRDEPHGACWGCGDPTTDWRLAAEKAGNAVLSIDPNLLIIVEGVAQYRDQYTWWGGNLMGAKDYPVRLKLRNRLVYSAHEYAQSIHPQLWFDDPHYPANLPAVWEKYWGYLSRENIAPVFIGEFGTRYETEKDRQWLQAFQTYIQTHQLSWTFWSLNPDSPDTGGLLLDDWSTVHQAKQNILRQIQYPLIEASCTSRAKN